LFEAKLVKSRATRQPQPPNPARFRDFIAFPQQSGFDLKPEAERLERPAATEC
jgi:hypothetical protein